METAGHHQVDLFILLRACSMMAFQLDGGEEVSYGLGRIGGGVEICLATADCTTDIRYCSSFAAAFCAVSVVPTCVDLLSFCISAATCFETSVEICLDHVDLSGPQGFLTYEGLCVSGLFCHHSLNSRCCLHISFLYS